MQSSGPHKSVNIKKIVAHIVDGICVGLTWLALYSYRLSWTNLVIWYVNSTQPFWG